MLAEEQYCCDVVLTERQTGWPVDGKTEGDAVASPENAEKFWQEISCELQDNYVSVAQRFATIHH